MKPHEWQTLPSANHGRINHWKRYLGEKCPHGLEIIVVDGTYVRNHIQSDYVAGGTHGRWKFIPKNEIWIDDVFPESEWAYNAFHECTEGYLMMSKGMDYEKAHDIAKAQEDRWRHYDARKSQVRRKA
jgi:hypothetical protein